MDTYPTVAHYATHQSAASSGSDDQWLTAPFNAEILQLPIRGGRRYEVLRLCIEGRPTLILPFLGLLSPRAFQRACVYHWYQLPDLPRGERWRLTINRWLKGIEREYIPYTGPPVSQKAWLATVRQFEKDGGGA